MRCHHKQRVAHKYASDGSDVPPIGGTVSRPSYPQRVDSLLLVYPLAGGSKSEDEAPPPKTHAGLLCQTGSIGF